MLLSLTPHMLLSLMLLNQFEYSFLQFEYFISTGLHLLRACIPVLLKGLYLLLLLVDGIREQGVLIVQLTRGECRVKEGERERGEGEEGLVQVTLD